MFCLSKGAATFVAASLRTSLAVLLLLPVALLRPSAYADNTVNSSSPDGNAIVRQMMNTYRQATTIQEVTVANFAQPNGGTLSQSYNVKYQKPNLFAIVSVDPDNGTIAAYSDGKTLTYYSAGRDAFIQRAAVPGLAGSLAAMGEMSERLIHTGYDQTLNPISFLLARDMPREVSNVRFVGTRTVEGKNVFVVTGQADERWMVSVYPKPKMQPGRRDITLMIDSKTHLLVKATASLSWKEPGTGETFAFNLSEIHMNTRIDAPIAMREFGFMPPKGATRKY